VYILLLAPRPAGKARATSIPPAVCKERATQPMHTLFSDGPLVWLLLWNPQGGPERKLRIAA